MLAILLAILTRLRPRDGRDDCRTRWSRVWGDSLCWKYRMPEHEDFWLWNHEFFNAPLEGLLTTVVGPMPC